MSTLSDYLNLLKYGAEFAIGGCVLVVVLICMVASIIARQGEDRTRLAKLLADHDRDELERKTFQAQAGGHE